MHKIIFILLLPLMFIQGRLVKKNTPKLPEAAGARVGELGSGPEVSLLLLGDSAAAGVGVSKQQQALSGTVTSGLAAHFKVSWQLLAKSGANTEQTLKMLKKKHNEHALDFDIVVVSLGVNDVLSPISARQWRQKQVELVEFLTVVVKCRQLILTQVPPMGGFPALPQPLRWFLGKRCDEFNQQLTQLATTAPLILLDFGAELQPELMAVDGFHPGVQIYQHWGKSVVDTILLKHQMSV
ncbi:SGNH/GDSL hydrolase family protein [Shewanella gelidimarina]|uniref:SGNH/GDSL hydrolase family protein n=1 Tax=Shewanella gelidimarina TaxID=56813 RepID=UPI0020107CE4|nr:SGNH/GDSL hydrolase family protein [Shewanella gelidimarina]MCL1057633.1 SGNH/GDSL hydrolase family protein [Shewanella gelidimarina]